MSYCRWSTDNFSCDIYAYESDMGYIIHVCSGRYVGNIPKIDMSFIENNSEKNRNRYLETSKAQSDYLDKCGTEPINLPFAGETFTLYGIESFYEKMIELKEIGYNIPENVLDGIKAEWSSEQKDAVCDATEAGSSTGDDKKKK